MSGAASEPGLSTWNGHFYCFQPVPEMRKTATHKFSFFTLKNVTWQTFLISFTVQLCFLFRFVWIELVSLTWFLQIWVAIYVYGTMINWTTLIKKLMQKYIVKVSGSILNFFTIHLNGIWRLLWRYLWKPVLGGHPVLSGHHSIPRGCPFNTGFTVLICSFEWIKFLIFLFQFLSRLVYGCAACMLRGAFVWVPITLKHTALFTAPCSN